MRNLIRICAVAAIVAVLMPPIPAYAVQYETEIDYYTGCQPATFVGEADQDCSGAWSYYGTQGGDFRRIIKTNCNTGQIVSILYYVNCNGNWNPIDAINFGVCNLC
jgi:hypothetical protein